MDGPIIASLLGGFFGLFVTIVSVAFMLARKLGSMEQHFLSHDGRLEAVETKTNGHLHDHALGNLK